METNIIIAGVGGQGLVLSTQLICDAANLAGLDAKSNDVIGLSQRGGRIWGSIRIGEHIYSPNIPPKSGDYLLALEPLEGLRWSQSLKDGGVIFMNRAIIPPVPVIHEQAPYPEDIEEQLARKYRLIAFDANEEGRRLGNTKIANTFLIGGLARFMTIEKDVWEEAIKRNVPEKFLAINLEAFGIGYEKLGGGAV